MEFVLITALIAGVISYFALGFTHWATQTAFMQDLPILMRYTCGTGIITAIFLVWSFVQSEPIPAPWAWIGYFVILLGAGLGTITGHALDDWSGKRKKIHLLEKRVGDE